MHNFIANLLTQFQFEMINNTFIELTIEEMFLCVTVKTPYT